MGQEIVNELTLRIAGESGEGVITVAESICRVAARMGLHLATFRTFPPEIKGGPCMMQFRASEQPIFHHNDQADVLVAFNEEALLNNIGTLRKNGTLMYEAAIEASIPPLEGIHAVAIPFRRIATDIVGNRGSKNIVALGVLAHLFSLPQDQIVKLMEERFRRRGQAVLENNLKGLHAGIEYAEKHLSRANLPRLQPTSQSGKLLMTGNEAAAIGALAAGVDCFFGYPITPSSEIMEYLAKNLPRFGGRFLQTEDEISAIAGVCGASWAGRWAMTATSGPGVFFHRSHHQLLIVQLQARFHHQGVAADDYLDTVPDDDVEALRLAADRQTINLGVFRDVESITLDQHADRSLKMSQKNGAATVEGLLRQFA